MSMEELEVEAMMLPPDQRERLAERLLWSVGSDLAYERERAERPLGHQPDDDGDLLLHWAYDPPSG